MVTNKETRCGVDGRRPVEDHTDVGCQTLDSVAIVYSGIKNTLLAKISDPVN